MRIRAGAALAAMTALAACASGGASFAVYQQRGGAKEAFSPQGGAALVVLDRPADGAGPEAVAAAASLPQRIGGGAMRLIPAGDPASAGPRYVLGFAPAAMEALCAATGPLGEAPATGTDATAVICVGEKFLGGARMRTAASGPSDPGFGRALTALYGAAYSSGRSGSPSGRSGNRR